MTAEKGLPAEQNTLVLELVKLREEYDRYLKLSNLELQDREKLISIIKYLQAWVGQTLTLPPESLGIGSAMVREARLTEDGIVIMVDSHGMETRKSLEQFDSPTFLSIIQDATPVLARLVQEKKTAIVQADAPRIQFNIELTGNHLLLFDWRVYKLAVHNLGSDARGVRLTVGKVPPHSYGPLTVHKGEVKYLDLRYYRKLSTMESIPIEINCADSGGREYKGSGTIKTGGEDWQEIPMTAASAV